MENTKENMHIDIGAVTQLEWLGSTVINVTRVTATHLAWNPSS